MVFQSVPDAAEAVVQMLANGETIVMTFYGEKAGGYDQADIDALAAQMDLWANDYLLDRLSNQVTYVGVNVRGLANQVDLEAFDGTSSAVGNGTDAPLPNNVCKAYKRYTGLTGRSARGRVYHPLTVAMPDATDENRIGTGASTSLLAGLNQVQGYMATAGFTEVVVSRYTGGAARPTGVTYPVTVYQSTSNVLNTQRRRLPSS